MAVRATALPLRTVDEAGFSREPSPAVPAHGLAAHRVRHFASDPSASMNQTERFYRIDQLLNERGVASFQVLQQTLEVSRATLRRDLTYMRERLHAPIVFDADAGGYQYGKPGRGPKFQLPGLWFTADEVLALMTMHQMLDSLGAGGMVGPHIRPLMARFTAILGAADVPAKEMLRRIKIIATPHRRSESKWFELIGSALVKRRRLRIDYYTRHRDEHSVREVSPLRLMHHRNNWYLDAWCHKSEDIRMFSLDAIEAATILEARARDVSLSRVDEELGAGYGIYRKAALHWAKLKFRPAAARWVRDEVWHEQQTLDELSDGGVVLTVPFSVSTELAMDILRHGENVEVLEPAELRATIRARLGAAAALYER